MLFFKNLNHVFVAFLFVCVCGLSFTQRIWSQEEGVEKHFTVEFSPVPGEETLDFGMLWPSHKSVRVITINCTPNCQELKEEFLEVNAPYSALFMKDNRYGTDGYIEVIYAPTRPGYHVDTLKLHYTASDGVNEVSDTIQWDLFGKAWSRDRVNRPSSK